MKKVLIGIFICIYIFFRIGSSEKSSFEKESKEIVPQNNTEALLDESITILEQVGVIENEEEYPELIEIISQLSKEDYISAIKYEENGQKPFTHNHIVLLTQNETDKIIIYGYESKEYGTRGIIVNYNGTLSYFDYTWNRSHGRRDVYKKDFNQDDSPEIYFCFQGSSGTGVNIERLVVFEPNSENKLIKASEFTGKIQYEKIKETLKIYINEHNNLVVIKDNKLEKEIDLSKYWSLANKEIYGIDCLNQIEYSITDDKILMCIDIGVWFSQGGPGVYFTDNTGKINFELTYLNGDFKLK